MNYKPNLFIAGFPKCGTSSLHAMLSQHSQIHVGINKEPQIYAKNHLYKHRDLFINKIFGVPEQNKKYVLDSSTAYSVYPKAIERIKRDTPNAKFIVICRDPFERVVSHYNWMVSLNLVKEPFKDEILKNGLGMHDPSLHYNGNYKTYIEASKYGKYLKKIISEFGLEKVLVLKFEQLFDDWDNQRNIIAQFLGLNNFATIAADHKNKTSRNVSKKESSTSLLEYFNKLKSLIRLEVSYFLGRRHRSQKIKNPIKKNIKLVETDLSFLVEYLEEDIQLFQELGYELDGWETANELLKKKY